MGYSGYSMRLVDCGGPACGWLLSNESIQTKSGFESMHTMPREHGFGVDSGTLYLWSGHGVLRTTGYRIVDQGFHFDLWMEGSASWHQLLLGGLRQQKYHVQLTHGSGPRSGALAWRPFTRWKSKHLCYSLLCTYDMYRTYLHDTLYGVQKVRKGSNTGTR